MGVVNLYEVGKRGEGGSPVLLLPPPPFFVIVRKVAKVMRTVINPVFFSSFLRLNPSYIGGRLTSDVSNVK